MSAGGGIVPTVQYSLSSRVIRLSGETSAAYRDGGEVGEWVRREVRRDARVLARSLGRTIEVRDRDGAALCEVGSDDEVGGG